MSIKAMKQALEYLERYEYAEARVTLRQAIEQAEKQQALDKKAENARELGLDYEPVQVDKKGPDAWMYEFGTDHCDAVTPVRWYKNVTALKKPDPNENLVRNVRPLYLEPQREWVGLTDEEIDQGLCRTPYAMKTAEAWREGVRWAYHQLKEKNT